MEGQYMNTMKQNYLSPQICSSHIWPWGGGRETTDGEKNNLSAIQALGDDQNIFKKYYSESKFTWNVVNKPCIFHWKFQPNFCENNECQRMFEGSVWRMDMQQPDKRTSLLFFLVPFTSSFFSRDMPSPNKASVGIPVGFPAEKGNGLCSRSTKRADSQFELRT